jgi:hypothetical protein
MHLMGMRPLAALSTFARREADTYRGGAQRPLGGYLGLLGVYAGATGAGAMWAAVRRRGRPGDVRREFAPWDVAQMAVATHKLSRMIAKDPVVSPVRAPFTRYQGLSAPGELAEEVRGDGWRHSVGELLTCPMCLAQWVATGLGLGLLIAPRTTRVTLATFTAVAGADFLQHAYVRLQQSTEQQG